MERFRLMKVDSENQSSRHWHQDAECRQNRSSLTAAVDGRSRSIAGQPWSRTKNEDDTMKGSARSKCDSKVESQRHGRMSAEDVRIQAKWD